MRITGPMIEELLKKHPEVELISGTFYHVFPDGHIGCCPIGLITYDKYPKDLVLFIGKAASILGQSEDYVDSFWGGFDFCSKANSIGWNDGSEVRKYCKEKGLLK